MNLRIIGGEYGGRVLRSTKGFGTRPLLGQVREALFDILGDRIVGAEVWDLFAGTGATGLEALSRGAGRVLFLEKSNQALRVLRENIELVGSGANGSDAKARTHVLRTDAWDPAPLRPEGEETEVRPDVVFLDPPYAAVGEDPVRAACRAEALRERLAPGGIVCFHFMRGHLDEDDFERGGKLREWGRSVVAFLPATEKTAAGDADP